MAEKRSNCVTIPREPNPKFVKYRIVWDDMAGGEIPFPFLLERADLKHDNDKPVWKKKDSFGTVAEAQNAADDDIAADADADSDCKRKLKWN